MDAMNGIETIRGEAEKVDKTKGRKRKASYIRRPNEFTRIDSQNALELSPTFYNDVFLFAHEDLARFRYNCRFVAHRRSIPFTHLVRALNKVGVKISRTSFLAKDVKHTFPKSLLLSTFALALGVPTWLLLSDNIESDCERLKIF